MGRSGHHRGDVESVVRPDNFLKWAYNEIDDLLYHQTMRKLKDDELFCLEALKLVAKKWDNKRVPRQTPPPSFCGDCNAPLLIYSSHICTNPECEHYLDVPF